MPWNPPHDRYDPAFAEAALTKCIIEIQHYLRHIRLHADRNMAREFHTQIFKLEADSRRVTKELKNDID
jgi:hypothetical protein